MNPRPSKIIGVGRNYREHARELGNEVPAEPLIFLKPPSSIIGPGEPIVLPRASVRVEFEGEIGIVIGRRVRRADERAASDAIGGLVAVNDVTARDLQKRDSQWTRAKGFDSFTAVGPVSEDARALETLEVVTHVNGEERQRASVGEMVFAVPALISYISSIMTLEPGDLIATGTPAGVGPLAPGDVVSVDIGVSRIENPVIAER